MKKNGFTTVELITSFSIASVVMLVLFNVVIMMKDNLSKANIKTNALVAKDNLSYNINKRLKEKELSSITTCDDGDKCYEFSYSDDTKDKLVYSSTDKTIIFNNYTFDIIDGITIEEPTITEHYDTMSSTTYNGYFIINIPITLDNKDYSIKVVKYFNTENLYLDISDYCRDNYGNIYTKVEYLESTGTQYIDSEKRLTIDTEFQLKYGFTKRHDYYATPYGLVQDNNYLGLYAFGNQAVFTSFGDKFDVGYTDNIIDYFKEYKHNKYGVWVDGEKKVTYENTSVNNSNASIIIFARIKDNEVSRNSSMKLFYFKIYDNDTLVRDYIPVIDSSNRPCLFDKVSKSCFYNQGTGEFLWG